MTDDWCTYLLFIKNARQVFVSKWCGAGGGAWTLDCIGT